MSCFESKGGRMAYIPCLNERHDWITALSQLTRRHLGHWLDLPATDSAALTVQRARALGAAR